MPDNLFKQGYIAGWRSIRGIDDIAAIPPRPDGVGETAFRYGVTQGVADAIRTGCTVRGGSADFDAWFDRALHRS